MTTSNNNLNVFDVIQLSFLATDFKRLCNPAILDPTPVTSPYPYSSSYLSSHDPPSYIPSSDPINSNPSGLNEINEICQYNIHDSKTSENKSKEKSISKWTY